MKKKGTAPPSNTPHSRAEHMIDWAEQCLRALSVFCCCRWRYSDSKRNSIVLMFQIMGRRVQLATNIMLKSHENDGAIKFLLKKYKPTENKSWHKQEWWKKTQAAAAIVASN